MSTSAERMRRLRERRAASIGSAPGAPLRDADELLVPAVEETLAALKLGERDAAAAQLARTYARVIDQAADQAQALRWVGPLLLKSLEALGATPLSRAGAKPKPAERVAPSGVALLRAAHMAKVAKRQRSG
jgi:hypothetical protein